MDLGTNFYSNSSNDLMSNSYSPNYFTSQKNPYANNSNLNYYSSEINNSLYNGQIRLNNFVKKGNLENEISIEEKKVRPYSSFTAHNMDNLSNKKTLVLDLDETLVHSSFTPFPGKNDIILNINLDGEIRTLYALKRPYVEEFLKELSSFYEIIIFTASISEYANPLLNELDKNKLIKFRLFRQHCTFEDGIYIKDLKIFDRKISNMIIIDNNPLSYDNNRENGIPILSWYDDPNDKELMKLLPILKYMASQDIKDVRYILNDIVDKTRNEINYNAISRILTQENKINENENSLSSSNITMNNKYRKNNKSQEPKKNIEKNGNYYVYNNNNTYYEEFNRMKPIKNNYMNGKIEKGKINNLKTIINKNDESQYNGSIDKRDPNGIRRSIFAPEEYNITSLNHFNNNYNNIENQSQQSRDKENNSYVKPKYSYNTFENNYLEKTNIKNNNNSISKNLANQISLMELTKNLLHIDDNEISNNNQRETRFRNYSSNTSRDFYRPKGYVNKENEMINGGDIKLKYANYKSSENFNTYVNNRYGEQDKNIFDYNNQNNRYNNILTINDKLRNDPYEKKLLTRINNEKIDDYNKRFKKRNNVEKLTDNNYSTNYSLMNKDNYFHILKQGLNYNNSNKDNNAISEYKYRNYLKKLESKNTFNSRINHNEEKKPNNYYSENNNNLGSKMFLKNSIKNKIINKEQYDTNYLIRSSNYINLNKSLNKPINMLNNENKENMTTNTNYVKGKISSSKLDWNRNIPKYTVNHNRFYDKFTII